MIRIKFNNDKEMMDFLDENHYHETKFFSTPNYPKAIVGISDDGRLIYSYELMVEELYKSFVNTNMEDPYIEAMETVDYNVCPMGASFPIVLYEKPMDGYDNFFEKEGIDDFLLPYEEYELGMNLQDELLFDVETPPEIKEKINNYLTEQNITFHYI